MCGLFDIASEWAMKAIAMGERFGAEAVVVHALNTHGVSQICLGIDDGWARLDESLRRATAGDLEEDIARAFNNLIAASRQDRRYHLFDKYSTEAAVFFEEHDLDSSSLCLIGDIADGLFERGRWAEAESQARFVVERGTQRGRASVWPFWVGWRPVAATRIRSCSWMRRWRSNSGLAEKSCTR